MFAKLAQWWETEKVKGQLLKDPLIVQARESIARNWSDSPIITSRYSEEFRNNQASQFMERAIQVATSSNRVAANRAELSGMAIATANYQVLILEPEPAPDVTGVRGRLGITGELRPHYRALIELDSTLAEMAHSFPSAMSDEDIYAAIVLQYHRLHALMTMHHQLRWPLDDYNKSPDKDWFKPMYLCFCACAENHYRSILGLPLQIEPIEALQFHTILDFVNSDERWPDLAWERHYETRIPRLAN
jgi:hypothetical protein